MVWKKKISIIDKTCFFLQDLTAEQFIAKGGRCQPNDHKGPGVYFKETLNSINNASQLFHLQALMSATAKWNKFRKLEKHVERK